MRGEVLARLRTASSRTRHDAGFGMVELVIAMAVMSVGILALFGMFNAGMVQIRRASNITTAAALADSEMEKFRAGKYDVIGLPDAQVLGADSRYKGDVAFIGDASTTLSAAITSGATTISVASNTGFPAVPFRIGIDGEILIVTATSGTTWTVARGADASTAAAHAAGATVSLKMRVDVPACGTGTCTTSTPSRTITGADGKSYRLDTYVTWKPITNSSNVVGRSTKLVTLVVRGTTNTWRTYARVSSAFDLSTGL